MEAIGPEPSSKPDLHLLQHVTEEPEKDPSFIRTSICEPSLGFGSRVRFLQLRLFHQGQLKVSLTDT